MKGALAWVLVAMWASPASAVMQTMTLSCAVAYLPARSTWVREVQIDWEGQSMRAIRIDGVAPYRYGLLPQGFITAIDNERIQLDLKQAQWTSDFRGQASGQGRCEVLAR